MDDLQELYQEVILDHNRNPKNFREMEHPSHSSTGYNPLCGDRINIYLKVEGGVVKDVSFKGSGCAISKASASLMTTVLKGRPVEEVERIFDKFQKLVTGQAGAESDISDLGQLVVLSGVREFPVRVKCATLAWHTLKAALEQNRDKEEYVVTTE